MKYKDYQNIEIMEHPLIKHKITMLRNKETKTAEFRSLVEEIAMLEAQEAEKRPTVLLTGTGVNPDEMSPQEFDAHLDEFYKGTVSEF